MSLKDFLYFSKGERRALMVVLALIAVAAIMLMLRQKGIEKPIDNQVIQRDTVYIQSSPSPETRTDDLTPTKPSRPIAGTPRKTPEAKKESVKERVERMASIGKPNYTKYPKAEKFDVGTVVELNGADTTILKKVPGIGSAFAGRIVKYRDLLGGFYSVTQLGEVYGMDEERYAALVPWFAADGSGIRKLAVNLLPLDSLRRHPYINYKQAKVIAQLRRQKGKLTGWENLQLLEEFTEADIERLRHYLSFE